MLFAQLLWENKRGRLLKEERKAGMEARYPGLGER
jgi:hypothetical protein